MRNIFRASIATVMFLGLVSCTTGPQTSASFQNDAGATPSNPIPATIKYLQMPDGRVFECIVSSTYGGYYSTDCNWDHPIRGQR